jgi:uncharacterized protein YcfJ
MKFAPHTVLPLSALLAAFVAPGAFATEFGTVVSSTPVYSQVPVPQRVCEDEQVSVAQRPSGAGAVAGAIIGGAVGNAVGAGGGRAAATALGLMLGAVAGNNAEASSLPPASATAQRCRTVTQYEDRPVGYDVVYEYAGARRTARLGQDPGGPGSRIALDVAPAGAVASTRSGRVGEPVPPAGSQRSYSRRDEAPVAQDDGYYAPPPRVVYAAPYYVAPPPVYYVPSPVYYGYPYPAASIWIGGRWNGGHRGH